MTTVRDSLYVHGNIPCPTPTYSLPPSRQGYADTNQAKPVRYNSSKAPPMNTEEELRNILRQAKKPVSHGPTSVTKRNDYFRKIKHLNDGMYGHNAPPSEPDLNYSYVDDFILEGKKVDDVPEIPEEQKPQQHNTPQPQSLEFLDLDGRETMHSASGMPARGFRLSAQSKSAKSFKSFYTSSSDPVRPSRSLTLPQLTIGSTRHKTRGDYINDNEPLSLAVNNALAGKENGIDEYGDLRLPSPSPRRATGMRGDRTPKRHVAGNFASMSIKDLKSCLHINKPLPAMKPEQEDYIIQDYLTQFKQAQEHAKQIQRMKRGSATINPFKLMNSPKGTNAQHIHQSPRYEFKTVESYLKFNKNRTNDMRTASVHGQSAQAQAYSDTLLLKMMTDLNKPAEHARSQANLAAVRLLNQEDFTVKNHQHQIVPCNSPVHRKSSKPPSAQHDKPKVMMQHIVYVPSGQTAKVRLLKG